MKRITPITMLTGVLLVAMTSTSHADDVEFCGETYPLDATRVWCDDDVDDLSPLAALEDLEVISVYETSVSDLTPLADLTKLRELELADTNVTDLTPLSDIQSLEYLGLSGTAVMDLGPLFGLANLKSLDLAAMMLVMEDDPQIDALRAAKPNCEIYVNY